VFVLKLFYFILIFIKIIQENKIILNYYIWTFSRGKTNQININFPQGGFDFLNYQRIVSYQLIDLIF